MVYHESQPSRKSAATTAKEKAMRAKKLEAEEDKGRGKGREWDGSTAEAPKCKYYLTQGGCKKGRDCRFSHDQAATFVEAVNIWFQDVRGRRVRRHQRR